jgi:PAS domain S-box-containing protein
MMSDADRSGWFAIWSHRPRFLHLGLFFAAYVLGCAFAEVMGVVPGTNIAIWLPGGLFIATLILTSPYSWPWWMLTGCLAELLGQLLWWHTPLPAGFLIYVGNALEAAVGAWLVNRVCRRPVRLETLPEVLAFVGLAAGIAPVISATVGSATLAWFGVKSQTFWAAWPLWWIGDATGILIVAPLALVVIQNWRRKAALSAGRWIEAAVLGLIFLGVAALSLSGHLPFAYIVMPPLLWAAVRFQVKGAAITLALLAVIALVFTLSGAGQGAGNPETEKQRQLMLQLFLAISAFSALIVATISRQHQHALHSLRDREREFSQLVDMVPSHIWRLTPQGEPTFFNKRMVDFLGLDVSDTAKPGMSPLETLIGRAIHPDDAAAFRDSLGRSLATGETFALRYRLRRADGVYRWMSSRADPLRDHGGHIVQWYGLCHDIDDQMQAEEAVRQSERRYRHLFHYMPIGLTQVDAGKLVPLFRELRAQGVTELRTYIDEHPEFLPRALEALEVEEVNQHCVAMFGAQNGEEMRGPIARYWQPGLSTIRRSIEARYRGEEVFQEETRVARMDGSVIDVLFTTARPGAVADKSLVGFIDITERKKAEAALRIRERELSQLVDMVPSHVWRLTSDGEPTFYNRRLVDFLGFDVADVGTPGMTRLASAIADFVHPDDAAGLGTALKRSFATGEPFSMKYRLRRADGVYRWLESRAEPLRDDSGAIVQWFGANVDIDDQTRLFGELEEREARIRRLVESDIIGIVIWDLDGRLIDANDAFLRMVQCDREDLQAGLRWFDMTPPEWQDVHARDEAEELKATGKMQAREKEFFRKDGSRVPVLIGAACFEGQSRQGVAYILDLSERKHAEKALRQSEQRLRHLIDALPAMIWSTTPEGTPSYVNKRFTDVTGASVDDIIAPDGAFSLSVIHPDDKAAAAQAVARSFSTGAPYVILYRQLRRGGMYRWTETRAEPLRDEAGAILQWYGVSVDIDDMICAQEALRGSERTLRQLVETLPALIYCAAPNGEPTYRSRQLREYLGFDVDEKSGEDRTRLTGTLDAVIHPDEVAAVKERYGHSLRTGEPYALKHRLRRFDGEYRWVETRAAAMRNAEGAIVQWNGICLDIEDQVRAQDALRLTQETLARASQAASLAELSASIAHEVNQPLAAVVANSHACQRWLTADPPNIARAQKTVERITRDANSAADVVSRIRALFRQSVKTRNLVALEGVIREARELMAEEAVRRRIRVDVAVEGQLPLVAFDRVQVQQVLINLIRNGMEAMESVASDRLLRMRVRRFEDEIRTEISDRGRGIEFPEKIFEPFFTTKENGMGMGLAICRSIVESHGGRMWTEKNEPHGAVFIFTLPIEAKAAS